ncbi:MAG: hypothetical protein GWN61_21325 [candidate division Zixibacteria bacterium]|nr:DUF1349 domain-containing protein [Phycisphaerae bacterium]NIR66953.1 DUF1349 domain-containing protein [candidate division Zixibacteria bacterium]NIS52570.1 DUF1349 domain-containing protein [Phycisphaerae bacterium]NIV08647.1 hypothetical protein [candidate division Zixibacteria bacterium]NIW98082.1 hypothetical protein [Phycisphaerae bacterium]
MEKILYTLYVLQNSNDYKKVKKMRANILRILILVIVLVGSASGWSNRDIGNPSVPGSAYFDPDTGTGTITADGNDIWGNSDNFHYVYKYLKGDGQITAQVNSINGPGTSEWAKAGVMIREGLSGESRHALMVMTPGHGAALQWRSNTGGVTFNVNQEGLAVPYWVRLIRNGDTFTGYYSPNNMGWTQLGAPLTIPMNKNVYIGLLLTSQQEGVPRTAEFGVVETIGNTGLAPVFTYQGLLIDADQPADGLHDFEVKLYDISGGGTQQGRTNTVEDVDVIDGYFTAELEFGIDVFDGNARWLEIGVRPGDSTGSFTTLSPRQEVTPTPYALYADTDNDWMVSGENMYSTLPGNVGIGTANPTEKLDVEGNIDVSSNKIKNYYGFPRPNYDSGWVSVSPGLRVKLNHNLGGDPNNYVVDMQFKGDFDGECVIHCKGIGGDWYNSFMGTSTYELKWEGAFWHSLTYESISVGRSNDDPFADQARVRIWIYD